MNKNLVMDCIKLCVITLIAGLLLGIVYNVTKAPIAAQEEKTKQEAYKAVFEDAAKFDLRIAKTGYFFFAIVTIV